MHSPSLLRQGARARWFGVAVVVAAGTLFGTAGPGHAAGPQATITPSTGLKDGQITVVRGSGFPPHTNIEILECAGTLAHPPRDLTSCEGLSGDTTAYTDIHGTFADMPADPTQRSSGYEVMLIPGPHAKLVSNRCGPSNPCVLYVGVNFEDFTQPHTFVAFSFAGAHSTTGSSGVTVLVVVIAGVLLAVGGAVVVLRRRTSNATAKPDGQMASR